MTSALVNRKSELALLLGRLEQTIASGEGVTVAVHGEAGIGKSKLLTHLCEVAAARHAEAGLLVGYGQAMMKLPGLRLLPGGSRLPENPHPFRRALWIPRVAEQACRLVPPASPGLGGIRAGDRWPARESETFWGRRTDRRCRRTGGGPEERQAWRTG